MRERGGSAEKRRKRRLRKAAICRLWLVVLLVMLLDAPAARSQEAGAFARMGFGARGVAMGNALAADVSGRASPYYNPALAPFASRQSLAASVAFLSFGRTLQFLHFAAPIRPSAGIAAGLMHAAVSGIDGRDDSGYHTRDLSVDEYSFFLAFGARLGERLSGGAALKFYRADYLDALDPAESVGLDLGLTAQVTDRLALGLAVSDLLVRYEWDTSGAYGGEGRVTTDRFPVRVRFGGAYQLAGVAVQLMAEYEVRLAASEQAGGEAEAVRRGMLRLGGTYAPVEALELHAGLDNLNAGAGGLRPGAGFTVRQAIGQLPVRASYAFAWETRVRDPMHLLTLQLFL